MIVLAVCVVLGAGFWRGFSYDAILKATKECDYERLERLCSIPFANRDIRIDRDFLDAIFERAGNETPLEVACSNGDIVAAEILLRHGANPNARHQFGSRSSCLSWGICRGDVELVKLLIQYGAKKDEGEDGLQTYVVRWKNGMDGSLEQFAEMYRLIDTWHRVSPEEKDSILGNAAFCCNIEVTQFLVEQCGASLSMIDEQGQTVLHRCCNAGNAAEGDQIAYVDYVLAHSSVDLSICDETGKTAYDYAVENHKAELAKLVNIAD